MFKIPFKTTAALLGLLCSRAVAADIDLKGYHFEAQVVETSGRPFPEFRETGQPKLKVRRGQEYSVTIRNPLPVRVGVALSIDGLNSIDGKLTTPKKARKWMIDPYGQVTISGWQTSSRTSRKFVFTGEDASYAEWKEGKTGKPYTKNLGVIGVAWFWNEQELQRALHPPVPFAEREGMAYAKKSRSEAPSAAGSAAPAPERAGTGMGQEQANAVTEVEFNPTAGMYAVRDCLKIFYEFAEEPAQPQPFVSEEKDVDKFAEDMNISK
jgi:hypothetical protein